MRAEKMLVGLICDGNPNEATDHEWIDHALERCNDFGRLTGGPPDMVIFQSWVPRPTHVLPEDAPDSFTHLLLEVRCEPSSFPGDQGSAMTLKPLERLFDHRAVVQRMDVGQKPPRFSIAL